MTQTSHDRSETRQEPAHEQRLIDAARAQIPSNGTPDHSQTAASPSPMPSRSRPLPAAGSFPGYTILKEIHGGGQGMVYQAIQESTKQKVALKVIHEGPFADPRNRARLERGVRILAELDHPNIVRIIDSGEADGSMFYVMEFIPGHSLAAWLDARRRSSRQDPATPYRRWPWSSRTGGSGRSRQRQSDDIEAIVRLFIKICDAANAAHLRGVIHRDLKPGNIRIDERNEPHLLDFDLAKVLGGDIVDEGPAHARTITGEFLGTLRWASPEQIERAPAKIDMRTDVYSLGVMLYESLTGITPYPMLGTRREIEEHILHTDPPPPSRHRANIDADLDAIVLRCLAKPRERRYHSAGPIADDLRSFLAGAPVSARRDSTWYLAQKLIRRHKVGVVSAVIIAGGLMGALAMGLDYYREKFRIAEDHRVMAEQQATQLKLNTNVAMTAEAKLQRQTLGWFMAAWLVDQEQVAKSIRDQTLPDSPEHRAMQFLLDPTQPAEQFVAKMPAAQTALAYYAVGERMLKMNKPQEAIEAFRQCVDASPDGWHAGPARGRLTQLLKSTAP